MTTSPAIQNIIRFEQGELDSVETLELFAALIRSGLAWSLQGSYGRTARSLIDNGLLSEAGEVLDYTVDED